MNIASFRKPPPKLGVIFSLLSLIILNSRLAPATLTDGEVAETPSKTLISSYLDYGHGSTYSCNRQNSADSERLFTQLTQAKKDNPNSVSQDDFRNAALQFILESEKCYQVIEGAQQVQYGPIRINKGSLMVPGYLALGFVLDGRKWGTSNPFDPANPPRVAGGTVTFSFMGDGVDLSKEPESAPNENSFAITSIPSYQPCFLTEIRNAFAAWSAVANIQFVEVSDNGYYFDHPHAAGDIRIGAHTMDGPKITIGSIAIKGGDLAHAFGPPPWGTSAAGDLHFDSEENWTCDTSEVDIGWVALHEIGHSIGLDHASTRNAVMYDTYDASLNVLQPDDIAGAQAIYGLPSSPPACPESGSVILYFNADYDCSGLGENDGYVQRTRAGWQNMTGVMNENASSVKIPSGWSVMLFEHANRGGGKKCLNSTDSGLSDFNFLGNFPNTNVPIADHASSFEVFTSSNCGGTPTPVTPPTPIGDGIEIVSVDYPTTVLPGQSFTPSITVKVTEGQLLESRGDMLRNTDNNLFGAHQHVAVEGVVNTGQTYQFRFYSNDPITAPSSEGSYQTKWRVWRDNNWAGPEVTIAFQVKPPVDCNNPKDGITLYEFSDFRGRCIHVTSDVMYLGNTTFGNDVASSLRIVGNWTVTLFKDPDWNGTWQNFTGNINDLTNTQIGDNDAASVRVWRPGDLCATLPPGVTLYRGRDFTGISQTFNRDVMFLGNEPIGHDRIQSIIVCGRWTVTLFQDPDWNGTWENFTGSDSNLLDNQANDASSLRMVDSFDFCRTLPRGVTVYRGRNFSGLSQTFNRDVMFLGNEMIGDNNIKSIRLCGYNARLFRDPDWKGISQDFTGRQDDSLEDDVVYAPHDSVSSLRVLAKSPDKPDLIPDPRSGRSAPVVISSVSGTTINDTFYAGEPIFIDWGYKNNGFVNAPAHHVKLTIDGQTIFNHSFSSLNAGATNGFEDQSITWNTPGTFTVSLTVDSQSAVDESDEGNNVWSGQFTWGLRPPNQFNKNTPVNGATNQPLSVVLNWAESSGVSSYQYCYDTTDNNNCDTTWNDVGTTTSVDLPGLTPGTTYYWQVRATNSGGSTDADGNTWWSFSTLTSEASVSTTVSTSSIDPGGTALVSVSLLNVPPNAYSSAEFTCAFNAAFVEPNNTAFGSLFGADALAISTAPQNGEFIVAIAGTSGNKATTSGVAFTFNVKGLQAGQTAIECTARVSKGDGNLISLPSVGSATLTIGEVIITPTASQTPTATAAPTFTATETPVPPIPSTPTSTPTVTASTAPTDTPTPSSTATATASPTPTQQPMGTLTGQVFATEPVIVRLHNPANALIASIPANPDGAFSLTAPTGTYTVIATASGFLSAQGSFTVTGGSTTTLPTIHLLAGDIDNNNVIDQFDALTIGMNYNITTPSAADLNNDGIINVFDLELLAKNYRKSGPVVWQ